MGMIIYLLLSLAVLLPRIVPALSSIDIVTGNQAACAVTLDGRLMCWGDNSNGLFDTPNTIIDRPLEQFKEENSRITHAGLGTSHICIVRDSTKVLCKGGNNAGQCGQGNVATPVAILTETKTFPNASAIFKISARENSTCVLHSLASNSIGGSSNVFCWGLIGLPNDDATLNNLRLVPRQITTNTAVDIGVSTHKVAVLFDGSVQGFDFNDVGQLGIGVGIGATSSTSQNGLVVTPSTLRNTRQTTVCTGTKHTCVVTLDGRVACTGLNNRGQLGVSTPAGSSAATFQFIPESERVAFVACGSEYTCYILEVGVLKCFGANEFGQLGVKTTKDTTTPTPVSGFGKDRVVRVVLGQHTSFAILQDGNVFVWGRNDKGQFGLGRRSFANDNVTTPQLHDALTVLNRNEVPFPYGLQVFTAFFFTALAVGLALLFQEQYINSIHRKYALKFRRQDRTIFKLKSDIVTETRSTTTANLNAALQNMIKLASDYDQLKVRLGRAVGSNGIASFNSRASDIQDQIQNVLRQYQKIYHIATLATLIGLSNPDLEDEKAAQLVWIADVLSAASAKLPKKNIEADHVRLFGEHMAKLGDKRVDLPWPVDMTTGEIAFDAESDLEMAPVSPSPAAEMTNTENGNVPNGDAHANGAKTHKSTSKNINELTPVLLESDNWKDSESAFTGPGMNAYGELRMLARSVVPLFPISISTTKPNPKQVAAASLHRAGNAEAANDVERPQSSLDNVMGYIKRMCVGLYEWFMIWIVRPIPKLFKPVITRFREHSIFYGIILLMVVIIFAVFEAQRADQITSVGSAVRPSTRPGGFGVTFLPIPPQYEVERPLQSSAVPAIYGIMHCNLFFLGLLPLPLMRGVIRDLAQVEFARRNLPLNDAIFVHRFFAYCIFFGLMLACVIWLYVMGTECTSNEQDKACLAFDMTDPSPINNVFILRVVVWSTWFPILPLMYFVRRGPYAFLPQLVRQYYFEIVYYSHIAVAYVTILVALIARFTVFYPVLVSWIPYFLTMGWEYIRNTYRSIRLILADQESWSETLQANAKPKFHAGQWIYLYVPYDSKYFSWLVPVAHPFSIANAPRPRPRDGVPDVENGSGPASSEEGKLELHIGLIGREFLEHEGGNSWIFPASEPRSWTDKLRERIYDMHNSAKSPAKKHVYVLGPYGTAFEECFKGAKHTTAVVIGAGTGLTAAESVLREFVLSKTSNGVDDLPEMLWFVWSCATLDDLVWCWDTLVEQIKLIIVMEKVNSNRNLMKSLITSSNQIAWLGVTLYVTRLSRKDDLINFHRHMTERAAKLNDDADEVEGLGSSRDIRLFVTNFLLNQIQAGAIDDDDRHIKQLLNSVYFKSTMASTKSSSMAVAFCGPSQLASVVNAAKQELSELNIKVELSQDGQ